MALHYAFESEHKIRTLLENVSENLVKGGVFIGTIPNAYRIMKRLRASAELKFGNPIYTIKFESKEHDTAFGHQYLFELTDAIDNCPEYLVHFPTFKKQVPDEIRAK